MTNGTLTLNGTTGLTFTTGTGTADATLVFSGTQADINAALDGIAFTPASDYGGPATLSITTDDQGSSGSGPAYQVSNTVGITVNSINDPPVITLPAPQNSVEDTPFTISNANGNSILISDVDASPGTVRVTLTAPDGVLTLGNLNGLTFSVGDGTKDATMTFDGTLQTVNAALDGMVFSPNHNFFGPTSIQVIVNDLGNTGIGGPQQTTAQLDLNVAPVDDAPVLNTSNGAIQYTENDPPTAIDNNLKLSDVDNTTMAGATVAILNYVAGQDVLGFTNQNGITGNFNATTGTLTLTGTASVDAYRDALRSVTYFNTSDNPDPTPRDIRFTVSDGQLTASADRAVNVIPVNDAPTAENLVLTIQEDAGRTNVDLWKLFNDVEDPDSDLVLTLISASNKSLFSHINVNQQTGKLELDSAQDAFGSGTIVVRATDTGGLFVDTTIDITVAPVDDPPVVTTSDHGDNSYTATSASRWSSIRRLTSVTSIPRHSPALKCKSAATRRIRTFSPSRQPTASPAPSMPPPAR